LLQNRAHARDRSLLSLYSADLGNLIARHRAEKALRAAAMESSIANRMKSEFIANMSHELRTPLNAIIGFSGIIERLPATAENEKTIDYAGHISRAGTHLLDVINDILDISKIESGNFELSCDEISVHDSAAAAVELVRARVAEKKQRLDLMIAERLPPVWADNRRIKQVLLNLLSNANKFTPEGGRICLVATTDQKVVTIAVTDSGVGMTDEQVRNALRPFVQVKSQYTRDQEGTGLGLPIAKALVEMHGGRFIVSSAPEKGTAVAFTLAAAQPYRPTGSRTRSPDREPYGLDREPHVADREPYVADREPYVPDREPYLADREPYR
jgi:two-component system cell cycle sensor histidine kinase PleC